MRRVFRDRQKNKWIESGLEHVSDKNDAAQWLFYYLGKKYEGSFTLAYKRPLDFQWFNSWMREVPVQCGLMPISIIPNKESLRSIFGCILENVHLFQIAHSMLIMSSIMSRPIKMNVGITKMVQKLE
jgi:hypothetical protein